MLKRFSFLLLFLCLPALLFAQSALLTGQVRDGNGKPLDLASVSVEGGAGVTTDPQGMYRLQVPAGQRITVVFSYLGSEPVRESMTLAEGERRSLNRTLQLRAHQIRGVTTRRQRRSNNAGDISLLDPANANQIAGTADPITSILKSLTGPGRSELTNQYTVRGGNYDENLVYVNDFEIYRPYLIRSGQQEGLGFVNSDLVDNITFSLGGFQARYGDKMSSVLDVTYRRPSHFAGSAMVSLLGASLHLEGASRNDRLTYLVGLRQKTNQYLLQAQPTKGVYNPSFTDLQALINYRINDRWELEAIGNYARNRFSFYPESSTTSFGLLTQAYQLRVFYEGGEIDQFDSRFGGLSLTHRPNDRLRLKLLASGFQTDEQETYDISGEYLLGELETDLGKESFGQIKTYLGTGIIQSFARNYLQVNVGTIAHRGAWDGDRHQLQWGLDASFTQITDKLHEWERRDSAGFTQPYYQNRLEMMKYYHSSNTFNYTRYSGFLQDNFHFGDSSRLNLSAGLRFNYSDLNKEWILSPRLQATWRLSHSALVKFAAGLYAQPPFYREMRDLQGQVNEGLRAQKSLHILLGTEHNFRWGSRPLKLTTEVYYKRLWDLVPYEYDDVRIRYFGKNNAEGYAYGGELRIYGELLKGAPSWLSIGLMKSSEDILDDQIVTKDSTLIYPGYVPRPTDQRFMLGLFLQDYLPRNRNFKVNLNLMYATGLPFGPPDGNRYGDTLRIPAYKRADIGFSALLLDAARRERPSHSFMSSLESIWLSLEVFNLLGIQNTLSYTWIQDQSSGKTFAVPNRLTSRLLNLKLIVKF